MIDAEPTVPARLVCLGEVLIDLVPEAVPSPPAGVPVSRGETERFVKAAGGAPANVAVAASRLGVSSALLAAVGDDPFGDFLTRTLAENGVHVGAVGRVPEQTALAIVVLGRGGERDFMFYKHDAAHDQLSAAQVEGALQLPALAAAETLHLGSNSLAAQPARAASERAVELAGQRGLSLSFDVNYRAAFWPNQQEAVAAIGDLLPAADLVKLSLEELLLLTGEASRAAAERFAGELLEGRARLICVTLGAAGAWYFTATGSGEVAAPSVRSLDTTGAGDAFMAAVLAADLAGPACWSDTDCTRAAVGRACRYASLTTTVRGAIPAYGVPEVLAGFADPTAGAW